MDLSWYNSINKPLFTPPAWAFGPIWTVLYILMAVSVVMIFRHGWRNKKVRRALNIFGWQLVLNLLWSPIFFFAHQIGLALIVVLGLWYLIYQTIKSFSEIDKLAAYLLYPYLIWVTIASLLNLSVWYLNR